MENAANAIDDLIGQAKRLEKQGRRREALCSWRAAAAQAGDTRVLMRFGELSVELGELAEGEAAFLRAIEADPTFPDPYLELGCLYLKQPDRNVLRTAREYFAKYLTFEESAPAYTLLGVAEYRLGLDESATDSYTNALKIDPDYEEAHFNLGVILSKSDQAAAVAHYRRALEIDSDYQAAHREMGWSLVKLSEFAEGERHLRRAVELNPNDGRALMYLGNLLWRLESFSAAEATFRGAISAWPDDSAPYRCLAIFYEYEDRPQEAEALYKKSLEVDPDDPETNLRFASFLEARGEPDRALEYRKRAATLNR